MHSRAWLCHTRIHSAQRFSILSSLRKRVSPASMERQGIHVSSFPDCSAAGDEVSIIEQEIGGPFLIALALAVRKGDSVFALLALLPLSPPLFLKAPTSGERKLWNPLPNHRETVRAMP